MLAWLSVWSKGQTCIWPSWCHGHSLSLASVESRAVLPFWYRLTQVVPEKGPLNGCVCVHMWSSCSTDSINITQQMLEFSSTVIFTLCVPMYQLNLQATAEIQLVRQTMPYIKQGYHLNNTHTPIWWSFFRDYPGEPVPETWHQSGLYWSKRQWVAMASAGPYANLHLAADR